MILWLNEEKTKKLESTVRGYYDYHEFKMFGEKEPKMQWCDIGDYGDICTKTSMEFKVELNRLIDSISKVNFYRNKMAVDRDKSIETQYRVDSMCWCLSYKGALLRSLEKALLETEPNKDTEYTEASLLIRFAEIGKNLQSFVDEWNKKLEGSKEKTVIEE